MKIIPVINKMIEKGVSKIPTQVKGDVSESIAAIFLLFKGYTPLNYANERGVAQVDLFMEKKDTIVLVEVKFRKTLEKAHQAIHPLQRKALHSQAQLMQTTFPNKTIRIDAVFVFMHAPFIQHEENI